MNNIMKTNRTLAGWLALAALAIMATKGKL
jgi:hypothetical protein